MVKETIQWFPGHMNKARNEVKEIMPEMDIVIEVIDARIPYSSENPMVAALRGQKPVIKILNKADLADPERTQARHELFDRRRHMRQVRPRIRNLVDIEETRAGNMSGVVFGTAITAHVGQVPAGIQDPQVGIVQVFGQPLGRNERFGIVGEHGSPTAVITVCLGKRGTACKRVAP